MVYRALIKLCILSLLAVLGCSSAEKNKADNAADPDAYREIVIKSNDIDTHFLELKDEAKSLLQEQEYGQKQRMTVAVIAAGAYYWDGDRENAHKFAQEAFDSCPDHKIEFPQQWKAHLWLDNNKKNPDIQKLVQMKDYLLSCANYGYGDFKNANDAFVNDLEFATSSQLYQQALQRGLQDQELRKTSYLRWAGSIYKQNKAELAEQILLERWILDPKVEFSLGDPSMIDYFRGLVEKFRRDYRQFIEM